MNIPPECMPGQILIRNADDEWVCVWPRSGMRQRERCFFILLASVVTSLFGAAVLLLVWWR